jgi:glycosyltransferase involved in cell wall biosynthesis
MFSVIIPIYKAENYIERCLTSIINQTYQDFEIILVDDFSPDQSLEVAQKILLKYSKIAHQIVVHEENKGSGIARNTGIDAAKGDYIYFIDNDDWLAHNHVFELYAQHLKTKNYDFISTGLQYAYEDGSTKPSHLYKKIETPQELNETTDIMHHFLDNHIPVVLWSKLYSTEFLRKNKLYFQEGLKHEDELWTFQVCSFAQSALVLPQVVHNYFQNNPNSIMNTRSIENHLNSSTIIAEILKTTEDRQLLRYFDSEKLAAHLHKLSTFILHDTVLVQDRYHWQKVYASLRKFYQKSTLHNLIPKFKLPPYIAYIVLHEKMKKPSKIRNRFYRKFLARFSVI